VQARRFLAHVLAEAHHNAEFVRVDAEEEGIPGDDSNCHRTGKEQERTGNAAAAAHGLLHLILAALQNFFEIRGLSAAAPATAAARALAPRSTAAASGAPFPATATTLIAPGHRFFSLSVGLVRKSLERWLLAQRIKVASA
jgi:hypothetical protein